MAVALRSAGTGVGTASVATLTLNTPANVVAGDYMIAFLRNQSGASSSDWSPPAGWTKIGPAFTANNGSQRVTSMFGKFATSSEPASYDFGSPVTAARVVGVINAYSGVDPVTPVAASSGFSYTNTTTTIVSSFPGSSNLYTIQLWASEFSSPNSYALTFEGTDFTLQSEVFRAAGSTQNPPSEDTTVSRTAMRVWGGVSPSGGISNHTIVTSGTAANACAALIALNEVIITPPDSPSLAGHVLNSHNNGTGTTFVVDPDDANRVGTPIADGDWMILVLSTAGSYTSSQKPTPPAAGGWDTLMPFAQTGNGTACFGVYAKIRETGETTYTWSKTNAEPSPVNYKLIWGGGGDTNINHWVIGQFVDRNTNATNTTTLAPSVATSVDNTLAIALSFERTAATETDDQITCTNFTKVYTDLAAEGGDNLCVASSVVATAGATGDVTTTYPNPHTYNGSAGIIGVPPAIDDSDPVGVPQRIGYVTTDSGSTAVTSITLDPTTPTAGGAIADGDWMLALVAVNNSSLITPPSGWTAIHDDWGLIGTYRTKVYARKRHAGDTTYTFSNDSAIYMNAVLLWIRGAGDVSTWIIGAPKDRSTAPAETTTITTPSITTTASYTQVLALGFERTVAWEANVNSWTNTSGWFFTQQSMPANSIVTFAVGHKAMTSVGTTGDAVITYPNTQSVNGWGYQIGIPPVPPPSGLPIKVSDGSSLNDARFKLADGSGGFATPGAYKVVRPGYASVTQMLAQPVFYCAHRGGSTSFPEMSLYAYGQSALAGYPALELSLARTSDGVWFGLHDSSLDRTSLGTTGTTLTAANMTWAQVQAYNILGSSATGNPSQPDRPYMRWEELIAMYYGTHVLFVDPKVGMNFRSELLNMMDALPGNPTDHFIGKYYGIEGGPTGTSGWNYDCHARGYKTWGYFYDTDVSNYATYAPRWDILGMNYSALQTYWDQLTAAAPGKPIMGHICPNQGSVNNALSKGAVGLMVSGTAAVTPPVIV